MIIRRSSFLAVLTVGLLAAGGCKPASDPSGKPAPELILDKVINAPLTKVSGWKDLRGKIVVLEFFATWCEPCVDNIPHLNELSAKLEGEDIVFITITDESEETIDEFLKKTPISGWVAFDPEGKAFDAFRVRGRPKTVIVDKKGNYVTDTYPSSLEESDLRLLLAGQRPAGWKSAPKTESAASSGNGKPPLFEIRFGESSGSEMGMSASLGELEFQNLGIRNILQWAVDLPQSRIDVPASLAEKNFDVLVRVPPRSHDQIKPLLEEAAVNALGLTITREKRMADVFLLRDSGSRGSQMEKVDADHSKGYSSGQKRVKGGAMSLEELAERLEFPLERPVVDQTGLKGRYKLKVETENGTPEEWKKALIEQLGLTIEEGRREVVFLKVETSDQ